MGGHVCLPNCRARTNGIVARAACYGVAAWLAFAAAEILIVAVPRLLGDSVLLPTQYWRHLAILLTAYAGIGLLLGAATGFLLRRFQPDPDTGLASGRSIQTAVSLGLSGTFVLAAALSEATGVVYIANLAVGLLVLTALTLNLAGKTRLFHRLSNPWLAATVLVLVPIVLAIAVISLVEDSWSPAGLILAAVICLGLAAAVGIRRRRPAPGRRETGPWRSVLFSAGVLAFALILLGVVSPLPSMPAEDAAVTGTDGKPNIVMLILDTARADHLSLYGYERRTSPRMEELAREATLYRQAYATSDMSLPSHGSIFTGLYPRWHGSYCSRRSPQGRPLAEENRTLAEILSESGYRTAGISANHAYITEEFGMAQGFNLFVAAHRLPFFDNSLRMRELMYPLVAAGTANYEFDGILLRSGEINRSVFRLLDQLAESSRPFYLFVNYMDAHLPYRPPADYGDLFPGYDLAHTWAQVQELRSDMAEKKRTSLTEAEYRHLSAVYDGSLAYLDDQVGLLVDRLRSLGEYDNTLVLVTSDHGEMLGEKGLFEHGLGAYQELIRIPLLIKFPGQAEGRIETTAVSHVDLMPTILGVAGIPAPAGLHGRNIAAPPNHVEPVDIFAMHSPAEWLIRSHAWHAREEQTIIRDSVKLVDSPGRDRQLFDLAADPCEARDLFRADNPRAVELGAAMDRWMKDRPDDAKPDQGLSGKQLERLRSLGYIN